MSPSQLTSWLSVASPTCLMFESIPRPSRGKVPPWDSRPEGLSEQRASSPACSVCSLGARAVLAARPPPPPHLPPPTHPPPASPELCPVVLGDFAARTAPLDPNHPPLLSAQKVPLTGLGPKATLFPTRGTRHDLEGPVGPWGAPGSLALLMHFLCLTSEQELDNPHPRQAFPPGGKRESGGNRASRGWCPGRL